MSKGLREILEWFMDTALAITGSTNEVRIIEKEQDKLLDQTEEQIMALVPKQEITHEDLRSAKEHIFCDCYGCKLSNSYDDNHTKRIRND